jgi:hypothetical protein
MNDEQLAAGLRRAFGRYHLESHPIEAPSEPTSLVVPARPPLLARRRLLGGLSLAGLGAAVVLAMTLTFGLTPGTAEPQSVWAAWQPTPTKPDATTRKAATDRCPGITDAGPEATVPGSSVRYSQLPLMVQDQRGPVALFIFGDGTTFVHCLVWPNGDGTYSAVGGTAAYPAHEMPGRLELETVSQSWAAASPEPIEIVSMYGRTDAQRVVVTRDDGVSVVATVADGAFVAWWPGSSSPIAIVAYDAQGGAVASESFRPLPTPCTCNVEQPEATSADD